MILVFSLPLGPHAVLYNLGLAIVACFDFYAAGLYGLSYHLGNVYVLENVLSRFCLGSYLPSALSWFILRVYCSWNALSSSVVVFSIQKLDYDKSDVRK